MDRVYKSGAQAVAPLATENASGPYPIAGNPGGGIPATKPGPFWYHMITESLAQVILGAGLALDKTVLTRLKEAIVLLGAQGAWSTGDIKLTMKTVADAGWVMMNDGTIGNAASGGTTRANADTVALFTLLWTNVSNTWAAVSGGRGASAAADYAANKTIALTKKLGRAIAIAGAGSGLTSRALGETLGAETVTLSIAQMPLHDHPVAIRNAPTGASSTAVMANADPGGGSVTSGGTGGGGSHPIMQPVSHDNAMLKL
jgi:hypothetical protein